ncbi:MAG: hypothetical protein J1E62_04030 [Lachnospiraceae bacterium]|nr:hypothetical protein [Lachnospiraceae bacterium]
MGDVIAFLVFVGLIVAGILFAATGNFIKSNDLSKGVNGWLLFFGIMFPLIIYFICEGGASVLDVIVSLLLISVYIYVVLNYIAELKNKDIIMSLPEEMRETAVRTIRMRLLLAPLGAIVYFVVFVLIISAIKQMLERKK